MSSDRGRKDILPSAAPLSREHHRSLWPGSAGIQGDSLPRDRIACAAPSRHCFQRAALRGLFLPGLIPPACIPPVRRAIGARHRKREATMSDLTSLITALAGLVLAIAKLVQVWRQPP